MENPWLSPWLSIPLAEYEGHMALLEIGQAQMLAGELEFAVRRHSPKSIAIIGCAGGNGLDRLVESGIERIVGIDINPAYVEMVSRRFRSRISGLELHIADIQSALPQIASVDLVFAALILEYVDVAMTMRSLQTLCAPDGALVVILQAAGQNVEKTSPSPYKSIQLLAPAMRLLDVDDVKQQAVAAGFSLASSRVVSLRSGKDFVILCFGKD
jgi:cyclopropane fatty-acyl-phospholipid synthase-like methyltransferase